MSHMNQMLDFLFIARYKAFGQIQTLSTLFRNWILKFITKDTFSYKEKYIFNHQSNSETQYLFTYIYILFFLILFSHIGYIKFGSFLQIYVIVRNSYTAHWSGVSYEKFLQYFITQAKIFELQIKISQMFMKQNQKIIDSG